MNSNFVPPHLESHAIQGDFKFTDTRSFRLFVEGIKGLQAYEHSAQRQGLEKAEARLTECVSEYPFDVLPQFYLGVVKIFQGYRGTMDAIRIFENISADVPQLRIEAKYNAAQACIEQYTAESFNAARDYLSQCIQEIAGSTKPADVRLRLQAEVLILYLDIHDQLWRKRKDSVATLQLEISETAPQLSQRLDEFLKEFDKFTRIPQPARADILADYWNDRGILQEFQAWTALDPKKKKELAQTAIQSYVESLKWKLNWIPPKSNLARIHVELLQEYDRGLKYCDEVQQVRPDDNYCEYIRGQAWEGKKDIAKAIFHYEKAPYIPEAKKRLAALYEESGRKDDAIRAWQQVLAKHPDDIEALGAQARLKFPTTPASDAPPIK
ncbi:MAG: tetratricopeptide repeat protein [Acidobacteriia bacterium]|nr:tetratricopeptide repeat protein [Terriglobia bacterium]